MLRLVWSQFKKNSVEDEKKSIQEQLKLFQDCKSPCIVFAEVSGSIQGDPNRKLSTRPQMENDEWKNFCKKISEMGKYLEDQGIPLVIIITWELLLRLKKILRDF